MSIGFLENGVAWIGLAPKRNSSGGKIRLGSISKQGDVCRDGARDRLPAHAGDGLIGPPGTRWEACQEEGMHGCRLSTDRVAQISGDDGTSTPRA